MQLIAAYQTSTNPSSWPPPSPTSSRSSLKTAGKVRSGGRSAGGVGKRPTKRGGKVGSGGGGARGGEKTPTKRLVKRSGGAKKGPRTPPVSAAIHTSTP